MGFIFCQSCSTPGDIIHQFGSQLFRRFFIQVHKLDDRADKSFQDRYFLSDGDDIFNDKALEW